jgi:hypothetical protein
MFLGAICHDECRFEPADVIMASAVATVCHDKVKFSPALGVDRYTLGLKRFQLLRHEGRRSYFGSGWLRCVGSCWRVGDGEESVCCVDVFEPAKPDRCCDSDSGIGSFKGLHEWCYGHIGGLAEAICGRT